MSRPLESTLNVSMFIVFGIPSFIILIASLAPMLLFACFRSGYIALQRAISKPSPKSA